uniref:Uncharacterized protein n=1 Tax=Triticum urartu TaxID=4572 RepID=A0A8R7TV28_TRIUA
KSPPRSSPLRVLLFYISIPLEQRCSSPLLSIHPSSEPTKPIIPSAPLFSISVLQPHHTHAPVSSTAHAVAFPSIFLPVAPGSSMDAHGCISRNRWLLRVRWPVAARLWLGLRARGWLGLWQRRGSGGLLRVDLGGCLTGLRGSVPALRITVDPQRHPPHPDSLHRHQHGIEVRTGG